MALQPLDVEMTDADTDVISEDSSFYGVLFSIYCSPSG